MKWFPELWSGNRAEDDPLAGLRQWLGAFSTAVNLLSNDHRIWFLSAEQLPGRMARQSKHSLATVNVSS